MAFTPRKPFDEDDIDEEKEEEEEEGISSKLAQRLQKLKSKHTQASNTSTPAKIATKLLELDDEEEEGEEGDAHAEGGGDEEGEEVQEDEGEEEVAEEEEVGEGEGGEGAGEAGTDDADQTQKEGQESKGGTQSKKASKQWSMYFDDEDEEEKEKKKAVSKEELEKIKLDIQNRGVIYLSTVPPNMNPEKMKYYFTSNFGPVTRIHLAKKGLKDLKKYEAQTGYRSNYFYKEGWIEFKDKSVAKRVATCLSGTQLGGKGIEKKAVWNIRYLSKFKWSFLQDKLFNQKAEATKVMNQKLEEAKRDIDTYREQSEKANKMKKSSKLRKRMKEQPNAPIVQKAVYVPRESSSSTHHERKRLPVLSQIVPAKKPRHMSTEEAQ